MGFEQAGLDTAARAAFERLGWVHTPGFFSGTEVTLLDRYVEQTRALPERSGAQMIYREASRLDPPEQIVQRIEDFCPHHAGFDAVIRGGRLQLAIEQLFGAPAVLFKDKINFKMPGGSGFEPHQDQQAGWSIYAPLFITAMVSIDRATLSNGCLEMARGERIRHLIGSEWTPLTPGELHPDVLTPVPTEAGDVVFFDSYAAHASKPNLSGSQRRILYLTYNLASDGDHRTRYYADKRLSFPPDIDRLPGVEYRFRV